VIIIVKATILNAAILPGFVIPGKGLYGSPIRLAVDEE
jgi:hypothetical protein